MHHFSQPVTWHSTGTERRPWGHRLYAPNSQVGTGQQETSLRKLRGGPRPPLRKNEMTRKSVLQALWRKRTAEPQGTDILISAKPCVKHRHDACLARKDTVRSGPQQGHSQALPKLGKCAQRSLASPKHLLRPAGFLSLGTPFPQMAVSCLCSPDCPFHSPFSRAVTSEPPCGLPPPSPASHQAPQSSRQLSLD